jgi:hypothetical protein
MAIGLIVSRSGGITISSGSSVLPDEVIRFRVTNLDSLTIGARFVVKDQGGNIVLDQTAGRALFRDDAWLDVTFAASHYTIQGFEMWPWGQGEASNIFSLIVSPDAPGPPKPPGNLGGDIANVLKWTAVAAGVIAVGYLVVKSGAVDLAVAKVKTRI